MKEKIIFISSTGGHLTQLLQLKPMFDKYDYVLITEKNLVNEGLKNNYNLKLLTYTSRKRIFSFPFLFMFNIMKSIWYIISIRPKYIITTGAGTAVPLCYIGKILGCKIVYIESFARINSKSLAGRIIYPISNLFIVQWQEMQKLYPKAKYFGSIY